ncbi:MAG TPA: hypothetical protein VFN53_02905 [Acidobacteriaceae bacterium]|nr:hypothetical protein [Acidobacteriaceae bacterium]
MKTGQNRTISKYLLATSMAVLGIALSPLPNIWAQASDVPAQTTNGVAAPHPNQQLQMAEKVAHPPGPTRQLERLARKLNLTQDQQQRMLPLLQDRQQRMMKLRKDRSLNAKERRKQLRSLRKETRRKMEAILTDAQKKQFENMHRRNR